MSIAAAVFLLIPGVLIGAFTSEPAVLGIGISLLAVAAVADVVQILLQYITLAFLDEF